MSRTYRTATTRMEVCNNCNLPIWTYAKHTVEHGNKTCTCWDGEVVRKNGYIDNTRVFKKYSYHAYDKFHCASALPTRQCDKPYKIWDVDPPYGTKKPYQKMRNKSFRAQTKQVIRNRNERWEDKVFPIVKKQVMWDVW